MSKRGDVVAGPIFWDGSVTRIVDNGDGRVSPEVLTRRGWEAGGSLTFAIKGREVSAEEIFSLTGLKLPE
jgi:hypothetical protein